MNKKHTKKGFTLLELAIVMVIIGIIVSGVIVGQDLIQEAKINNIVSDFQQMQTSYNQYRSKYKAVPGDHLNAFDYFDTDCGANANACNGTGNLDLLDEPGSREYGERFMFFRHLYLAKMYNQDLTGVTNNAGGGEPSVVIEVNSPLTPIDGATYWVGTYPIADFLADGIGETGSTSASELNLFVIGRYDHGDDPASAPSIGALTAEQVYRIDLKLDDGKPASGAIIGAMTSESCATSTEYTLSKKESDCNAAIILEEHI